mgnify:CR=1 FL=1
MLRIAYFAGVDLDVYPLTRALRRVQEDKGHILEVLVRSMTDLASTATQEEFIEYALRADIAIFHFMGGKDSCPGFDTIAERLKGKVHIQVEGSSPDAAALALKLNSLPPEDSQLVSKYMAYGGEENYYNLFLFLAHRLKGENLQANPPVEIPWEGLYHPDLDGISTIEEYLQKRYSPDKLTLGLMFMRRLWVNGNREYFDTLIREIEAQGANVIPVFVQGARDVEIGNRGAVEAGINFFTKDGETIIDALITLLPLFNPMTFTDPSLGEQNAHLFRKLGVPVLQGIGTLSSLENWKESIQGLSPMDVAVSAALPELNGALITVTVAGRKYSEVDPLTGTRIVTFEPVPERINKLVRLALKWARLKRIPNQQKRIAIILYNYPPRNDAIGNAFGLDSLATVRNILRDMRDAGYLLDYLPKDGQDLIERIIERATNDRRWASPEEMARRAVAKVSSEQYLKWFQELPEEMQSKMVQAWGEPPGKLFNYRGELLIPGLINGNIFIGLQPPRGFSEDPSAIYHNPDLPVPYHYLFYYRWIRDVFKADAVMHIGMHGSLEWLPGKNAGLSQNCFPDMTISDLPNIYTYIMNNPSEGTQAKRRSYCCIIDHLIPVMHNADTYDETAELEVLLHDYYHAKRADQEKLPYLQKLIWEKTCQANLDNDLEIDEDTANLDFEGFLERLHGYLYDLKDTQIRDGLHILGEPPTNSRLDEFLVALTRLSNGDIPSLRKSIAELKGYDYEYLLANRGKLTADGRTCGSIIEECEGLALQLMQRWRSHGFALDVIDSLASEILGSIDSNIRTVLEYIASSIVPNIEATTEELTNTLLAADAHYILPGPAGAPTRGMADILPTGRNFYSVDPRTIPSPAAWRVGVALGNALLERYLKDEGRYPENIGIVAMGVTQMRTKGDCVAEALYLMGARPIWEGGSGRVKGVEVIPLEELGRPRIDVTIRISGSFRDALECVIHLLDDAVQMISNLDEPPEQNYLVKHIAEQVAEKVSQGIDQERAREEASYRIFGNRPGAYGAGVSELIDAKNWKEDQDLGNVYLAWGGYAYSRKQYGVMAMEEFKRRLSSIDLVTKNEDTKEWDMMDADDFYSYHGGFIAAVRAFKGEMPRCYTGDNSDPERVQVRSTAEEAKRVFRCRILNPKWIESMRRHGYKGAGDLSRAVDIAFGWDATAKVLEDWMYEELAQKYALDKDMQRWLKEVNPYALHNIAERLLEAIERGMWQATDEMKQELQSIYLDIEGILEESQAGMERTRRGV